MPVELSFVRRLLPSEVSVEYVFDPSSPWQDVIAVEAPEERLFVEAVSNCLESAGELEGF
jgi:hypothetical protein